MNALFFERFQLGWDQIGSGGARNLMIKIMLSPKHRKHQSSAKSTSVRIRSYSIDKFEILNAAIMSSVTDGI